MGKELTSERLAAWEALIRTVGALVKTFDSEMEKNFGLPLTWYDVLIQLSEAPEGRLRMQALADKVVLSRSGLTRLVDRMEKAELVRREHSTEDRRGYYAVLKEEGRQVFLRAQPIHHRDIQEHFARHLSDADVRALTRTIGKVSHAIHPPTD
jgi:DNA-binding MarR family transcriptional regulator